MRALILTLLLGGCTVASTRDQEPVQPPALVVPQDSSEEFHCDKLGQFLLCRPRRRAWMTRSVGYPLLHALPWLSGAQFPRSKPREIWRTHCAVRSGKTATREGPLADGKRRPLSLPGTTYCNSTLGLD
jgi:hypothetical protein